MKRFIKATQFKYFMKKLRNVVVAFLFNIGIAIYNEFNWQFKGQKKAICKPFRNWNKYS